METIVKKIRVTNVYQRNRESQANIIIHKGGAGSSKTYSLIQFFNHERLMIDPPLILPHYNLLILRKVRKSAKMSVYRDFIEYLELIDLYDPISHNKSDLEYTYPNGNRVVFTGLDDRAKIRSTQWGDIWLEEASDFSLEDMTFLKTRLYRGEL